MSSPLLFTVVGDSNVGLNMSPFNVRDRPGMTDAQVLTCSRLQVLPDALRSIRTASNVIILACITNILTAAEESSSVSARVLPILTEAACGGLLCLKSFYSGRDRSSHVSCSASLVQGRPSRDFDRVFLSDVCQPALQPSPDQ